MWVLINFLCKSSLGAPDYVTKILQAKNGQKVDDFEPMYIHISVITDIDEKWFVIFEHTINCLFVGYVRLPQLEYFFFFFFFFTFFSFLLFFSGYLLLNR